MDWHYLITLQYPGPDGLLASTSDGTFRPSATAMRTEAFREIFSYEKDRLGIDGPAAILFFSLDPDDLGVS